MIEFRDVEDLFWIEITTVVLINLLKPSVEFLDFFLGKLAWKFGVTHFFTLL